MPELLKIMKGNGRPPDFLSELRRKFPGQRGWFENFIADLHFSRQGQRLVLMESPYPVVTAWDWESGKPLFKNKEVAGGQILDLAIAPNDLHLAVAGKDTKIRYIPMDGGGNRGPYRYHQEAISAVAFGLNAECLVSGSEDGAIQFWECSQKGLLNYGSGRRSTGTAVVDIAVHSGGEMCASADSDGRIELWWLETGERVCPSLWVDTEITQIAFHPKRSLLLASGKDGNLYSWHIPVGQNTPGFFLPVAESIAGRKLDESGRLVSVEGGKDSSMEDVVVKRYLEKVRNGNVASDNDCFGFLYQYFGLSN